ncbi:MAG TPA: hypothetical protein VE110_12340 [Gemmatimonadaceae bacterium]|nr:hypothetical protein [Gemmatimonadaceae bacterium]
MHSENGDLQPPRWRLPAEHVARLEKSLSAGRARKTITAEQRAVIREICQAPERQRYAPEDFLIAFKLAVVDAATAARIPPGPDRNDFLARLVSVYIEEFYRAVFSVNQSDGASASQEQRAEF